MGSLCYPLYIIGVIKGDTRSLDYSSPGGTPPAFDCKRQELGLLADYYIIRGLQRGEIGVMEKNIATLG